MIMYPKEIIRRYEAKGWWGKKSLNDYLEENALEYRDKEAFVDSFGSRVTWGEVLKNVDRLALAFLELGVKKDDFVILQIPNCVEFVYVHYALSKIGAITVPVVNLFRTNELDYILGLSEATTAVIPWNYGGFSYGKMMLDLQKKNKQLKNIVVYGDAVPDGMISLKELLTTPFEEKYPPNYLAQFKPDPNEVISMCMTSGTEAQPKGTPRTHNNWISMLYSAAIKNWKRDKSEYIVYCGALPLANLFGLGMGLYGTTIMGQKTIFCDRFDPERVLQTIEDEKVTHLIAVPAMHIAILEFLDFAKYNLSSLIHVVTGGAPNPVSLIKDLQEKLGVVVANGYGSNEGAFLSTNWDDNDDPEIIAETVGKVSPRYEVKIVGEDRWALPPMQVGELAFWGPSIFAGYYKRPDLNAKVFDEDGFFYSGDLGIIGYDGYIRIVDRKKDIIIRGGQNISPQEVEFLLQMHPKVLYAAIVGMPDERLGEKACAFIQPKPGETITFGEMINFLKDKKIATYKLPERLEIVTEMPRTPTGKVAKNILRNLVS